MGPTRRPGTPPSHDPPVHLTEFPPSPASVRAARRFVTVACANLAPPELVDDIRLLTSELVTNVIVHARSNVALGVRCHDRSVRVEVGDRSPAPPTSHQAGPEDPAGRGMTLVETIASGWGVEERVDGKTVWFELGT